jgi:hypothetical protein
MNKVTLRILSLLVIASFALSACNPGAAFQQGWEAFSKGWSEPKPVDPETQAAIDAAVEDALKEAGLNNPTSEASPMNPAPADTNAPAENADTSMTDSNTKYDFVGTEWFRANVPYSDVVTKKPADPESNMPFPLTHLLGPEGVLGADDLDEANANKSAVWTGSGVYHRAPDTANFGFLGPEGSFSTIFAKKFDKIVLGDPNDPMFIISIPECGPHCAQGILIRSPLAEDGKDNHLPIWVEGVGAIGAASFTRYAVEPNWARVFSEGYWNDQADNALVFDNNGIGNKDTDSFIGHFIDVNDGSYTVAKYLGNGQWLVLWTNVSGHGQ